ncbi:MAG: hypothetical protein AAFN93_17325 [Bacteroidota bacterium]
MKIKDHTQMHEEHKVWTSDVNMRLHDIKIWEEELSALNSSMEIIRNRILDHEMLIGNHSKRLEYHKDLISEHDTTMVMLEEGSNLDEQLCESHDVGALRHEKLKSAHGKIKQYQRGVMVSVKDLRGTLEDFETHVRKA